MSLEIAGLLSISCLLIISFYIMYGQKVTQRTKRKKTAWTCEHKLGFSMPIGRVVSCERWCQVKPIIRWNVPRRDGCEAIYQPIERLL